MPIPHPQFFGQNGQPLAGCKIFTYITGTSTLLGTFTDATGTVPNQNPVTCDAGGFVSIWLIVGDTYRILVQDQFGVQQYIVDGVVGIGGGSLSLFSTPNTWTALQTFQGGASINGGTLNGVFAGSPSFSGTLQFTSFTISNPTEITNLNAQLWNGTSASPGGALTNGWVPIVTGPSASTWGPITASILPGSGITTINGVPCTIGSSCTGVSGLPNVVYSTPSASTSGSISAVTMVTVGGSNATYRESFAIDQTVLGAGCSGMTMVATNYTFQDPNAASPATFSAGTTFNIPGNGTLGIYVTGPPLSLRALSASNIQYSTTVTPDGSCGTRPQYQLFMILEQVSTN